MATARELVGGPLPRPFSTAGVTEARRLAEGLGIDLGRGAAEARQEVRERLRGLRLAAQDPAMSEDGRALLRLREMLP